MDRVEEIEAAIDSLPPEEFLRLSQWFRARDEALWDRQLDSDSAAGRLDFLFEEGQEENTKGSLRDWLASH
ncbi:MAG: hypothetical protein ACRD34_13570 [Bryobacteraceae bacterium]